MPLNFAALVGLPPDVNVTRNEILLIVFHLCFNAYFFCHQK